MQEEQKVIKKINSISSFKHLNKDHQIKLKIMYKSTKLIGRYEVILVSNLDRYKFTGHLIEDLNIQIVSLLR